MLHGTEPDLGLLRVSGARTFVHVETYSKNLELKAVEGRRVGYNNNSKSYRVYNPGTRRIVESRNVIFIETPSRHRRKKLRSRLIRQATAWTTTIKSQTMTFCAILAIIFPCRNPFPALLLTTSVVGGLSDNPPVAELLGWVSEVVRRDTLDREVAGPPQEGMMPGREPTDGFSLEIALEPQAQAVSPAGASMETPLAGSQPLHQRGHSHQEATPVVARAGTAAKSFVRRNAHDRSCSSHLAAIATGPALPEIRGLRLYTKETLPDIVHETYGADSAVIRLCRDEHSSCSVRENAEISPNTLQSGYDSTG